MRAELSGALDSLGGKTSNRLFDNFKVYSAAHINRASEGYVFLRQASRNDASRLLIRPAIETMIQLLAVKKQPDLLYRIAYTEWRKEKTWLGGSGVEHEKHWDEFKGVYTTQFPEHCLVEKQLSLECAAVVAGIGPYYQSHYRLYCQFEHSAIRAVTGGLNAITDKADNRTMALCVLTALEAAMSAGGSSANIDTLRERFSRLDED
jgi:hypothetical protein